MNTYATDNPPHALSNDLSLPEPAEAGRLGDRAWMTDDDLVASAQKNDLTALKELLDRHEAQVFRLAMRFVHDESDAREILQDVFVTTWRKLAGFEGRAQIGSWLYRVTANASLMFLRARNRRPMLTFSTLLPEDMAGEAANENHDSGLRGPPRPDEHLALAELRTEIQNAVDKLPDKLRQAFLAREIEGHSTSQAAESLGVSEEAIKARLCRARAALRQNLGDCLAI